MDKLDRMAEQLAIDMTNATLPERKAIANGYNDKVVDHLAGLPSMQTEEIVKGHTASPYTESKARAGIRNNHFIKARNQLRQQILKEFRGSNEK